MTWWRLCKGAVITDQRIEADSRPEDFTGHPAKSDWRWREEVVALVTPGDVRLPDLLEIVDDTVVVTPQFRTYSVEEVAAQRYASLRDLRGLQVMFIRLVEQLLADNTIQATDFSVELRQEFQSAQPIADQLDPNGA